MRKMTLKLVVATILFALGAAIIVPKPAEAIQCARYARKASMVKIRGNAWTWWFQAKGRYERHAEPRAHSVMVFQKTRRNRYGHVAIVKEVLNSRVVVVDHANWLNRGRIHRNAKVMDVSPNNNWSAVRVWYSPGKRWGSTIYPLYGFVSPNAPGTETNAIRMAKADDTAITGTELGGSGEELRSSRSSRRGPDLRVLILREEMNRLSQRNAQRAIDLKLDKVEAMLASLQ